MGSDGQGGFVGGGGVFFLDSWFFSIFFGGFELFPPPPHVLLHLCRFWSSLFSFHACVCACVCVAWHYFVLFGPGV